MEIFTSTETMVEQRGGCQQLLQRKGACYLLNKKKALSGFDPSEC